MDMANQPFWRRKTLNELSHDEWESLCDGCGQCCLVKLEDEDTGELVHTRLACRLLDIGACRCGDYDNRHEKVSDCARVTPQTVPLLGWLPSTCAYRLVAEGKNLQWWHPLVSCDPDTVYEAGISVRGWARSEAGISEDRITQYLISDPSRGKPPRRG